MVPIFSNFLRSLSSVLAIIVLSASTARATTWDWDPTGSTSGGSDLTGGVGTTWSEPGSVANWYEVGAGSNPNTYSGLAGDTVVFGSSNTGTAADIATISNTVTAGVIVFNNYGGSNKEGSYSLQGGSISGGGGALVIQAPLGAVGVNGNFHGVNLINASSYTILGASTPINTGIGFTNGTTVAGNLIVGSGSDFGTFQIAVGNAQTTTSSSGTITINNGWTFTNTNDLSVNSITQDLVINGMGNSGAGAIKANTFVTPTGGENYTGSIQVASDAAILGAQGQKGKNMSRGLYGNISSVGNANLYLGYQGVGTISTINSNLISTQQLLVGSTNGTASTNTGATIVFNSVAGDNTTATGGVASEAVLDATNNGLSNATTLVLGETGSFRETGASSVLPIGSPNSNTTGTAWKTSDGAFDLNGNSQTLQGLIVGGVGQNGGADVLVQGNNLIFNNGTGTATLTVTGKTGNAVATGFGGVIEDNVALNTTGGTANTNSNGGKVAVEVNGQGVANAATLILSGQNTYSGGTTVDHMGLLEVGTSTVSTGVTTTGTFGTGSLSVNTGGTVDLEGASVTVSSTTLGVAGDTATNTIQSSTGGSTGVTTTNGTLTSTNGVTVNGTSNVIASGVSVVAGSAGINVSASSALAVNSGATIDNLNVKTASSSATLNGTSTGNIVVGSGSSGTNGSLTGTGTANQLTLQSGGLITPGNGTVGSKLAASNISGTGTGELAFTLSASGGVTQETSLLLSGAFGSNSSNSFGIYLSGNVTGLTTPGTYNFELVGFNSTPFTNLSTISLVNAPTLDGQESGILTLLSNQLDYTVTVIPEPGTWAMLLGGVALLVIYQRRRRSS